MRANCRQLLTMSELGYAWGACLKHARKIVSHPHRVTNCKKGIAMAAVDREMPMTMDKEMWPALRCPRLLICPAPRFADIRYFQRRRMLTSIKIYIVKIHKITRPCGGYSTECIGPGLPGSSIDRTYVSSLEL